MLARKCLRATKSAITRGPSTSPPVKRDSLSRPPTLLSSSSNKWFQRLSCPATGNPKAGVTTPSSTTQRALPSSSRRAECTTRCSPKSSITTTSPMKKWRTSPTRTRTSPTPYHSKRGMWPRQSPRATRVIAQWGASKNREVVFCLLRARVRNYKNSHLTKKTSRKLLTREPSLSF